MITALELSVINLMKVAKAIEEGTCSDPQSIIPIAYVFADTKLKGCDEYTGFYVPFITKSEDFEFWS